MIRDGEHALITGSTGGVGTAISIGLARKGLRLTLVGRSATKLADLRARVAVDAKAPIASIVGALESAEDARHVHAEAGVHGPVTCLVNATGVFGPVCEPRDLDGDLLTHAQQVNFIAPIALCTIALGSMLERDSGRLINITSAHPLHGPDAPTLSYGTSKAALNFATRAIARSTAGTGVSACVVHPGDLRTAMWADIRSQAEGLGDAGRPLLDWAESVDRTGGDDPARVARTVLDIIEREPAWSNGRFIYAHGTRHHHPDPGW